MNLPSLTDATLDVQEGVATLTFQRDDVRNALTGTALAEDIVRTSEWVNGNDDVSVLVLTGAGSAFSAGGNVKEMEERRGIFSGAPFEIQERYRRGIQQISLALHRTEIPTIAAINGPAIGAGCDLACMCDLRIASTRAVLGETFVNLGIISGDGGSWFLQRLIGYQRAAELTFTGRLLSAEEAFALGLTLETVEADDLLPRTRDLASRIAAQPAPALRMSKRLLKASQRLDLPDFLDLCASFQATAHHTDAHDEALKAFLQARKTSSKR